MPPLFANLLTTFFCKVFHNSYFIVVFLYCNLSLLARYLFSCFTSSFSKLLLVSSNAMLHLQRMEPLPGHPIRIAILPHLQVRSSGWIHVERTLVHIHLGGGMKNDLSIFIVYTYIVVVGDSIHIRSECPPPLLAHFYSFFVLIIIVCGGGWFC